MNEVWIVMATVDRGGEEFHQVISLWRNYVKAQRESESMQNQLDTMMPGIGITIHVSGPWPLDMETDDGA